MAKVTKKAGAKRKPGSKKVGSKKVGSKKAGAKKAGAKKAASSEASTNTGATAQPRERGDSLSLIDQANYRVSQIQDAADQYEDGDQSKVRALIAAASAIEKLFPVVGNISEFFSAVGAGVANAQEQLDAETLRYLRDSRQKGREHVLPANFTLPRVHASMRFEVEEFSSKGIGLLFHRTSESQSKSVEHEISFDVIAMPPPPELRLQLSMRPLHFLFEADRPRLEALLAALDAKRAQLSALALQRLEDVMKDPAKLRFLRFDDVHLAMYWDSPRLTVIEIESGVVHVSNEPDDSVAGSLVPFFNHLFQVPTTEWKEVGERVKDLKLAAKAAQKAGFTPETVKQLAEQADRLEEAIVWGEDKQSQKIGEDENDGSPLSSFMLQVAQSVIVAQRELDDRSAKYLDQLRRSGVGDHLGGGLPATVFRIPQAKAKLRLAVRQARGRKLRAIVYRREERESNQLEQEISFDVVSGPLEPDALREPILSSEGARVKTLVHVDAPGERETVREVLVSYAGRDNVHATKRAKIETLSEPETFARATILRHEDGYMLLSRQGKDRNRLEAVYLRQKGASYKVDVLAKPSEPLHESHRWFFDRWLP